MFKCSKCNYHVPVEGTEKCSQCARLESMEFHRAVVTKNHPTNLSPLHHRVWTELVHHGKKWRINDRYTRGCGHPYVKDTQGKCVFCRIEAQQSDTGGLSNEQIADNLMESAAVLRKRADDLEVKAIYIRTGLYTPEKEDILTNRQKAVLAGAKWYEHDEPCKSCGKIGERYVANGRCRNCGK